MPKHPTNAERRPSGRRAAKIAVPAERRGGRSNNARVNRPPDDSFDTKETPQINRNRRPARTAVSPVEAAKKCQARVKIYERGFQKRTRQVLKEAYQIAKDFKCRPDEWRKFAQDEFWNGCKRKRPNEETITDDLMLFVLRFIYEVTMTSGLLYNRVYKYSRALSEFDREGVELAAVEGKLAERGVDFVYGAAETSPEDEQGAQDFVSKRQKGEQQTENPAERVQERQRNDDQHQSSVEVGNAKHHVAKPENLEVEIDPVLLNRVLRLEPGQQADLLIERVGGPAISPRPSGFVRIVARVVSVRRK